jgi:hypothetical protein
MTANTGDVVERYLHSCEYEIKRLGEILHELKEDKSPSDSFNHKLQVQAGKLSYPFKQRNLCRLEDSVQKLNSILSTALQATELFVTLILSPSANRIPGLSRRRCAANPATLGMSALLSLKNSPSSRQSQRPRQIMSPRSWTPFRH